jgi:hypothetical protein
MDRPQSDLLGRRKAHAIQTLNIENAAKIESEIQTHRQTQMLEMVEDAKAELVDAITQFHTKYTESCDQVRQTADSERLEFRTSIDDGFSFWQRSHLEELSTLEKEYALAIVREEHRPVKAKLDFEKQARELAKQNEFEASIRFREKGQAAEQAELERRRAAVDGAFDRKRHCLMERQRNDLENLRMKLASGLILSEQALQANLQKEQRAFLVAVRAKVQQKVVSRMAKVQGGSKKHVSLELTKAANEVTLRLAGLPLGTTTATKGKQKRATLRGSKNFMPELEPLIVDEEFVEDLPPLEGLSLAQFTRNANACTGSH